MVVEDCDPAPALIPILVPIPITSIGLKKVLVDVWKTRYPPCTNIDNGTNTLTISGTGTHTDILASTGVFEGNCIQISDITLPYEEDFRTSL